MANAKEIRGRIASVQSTQKITRAMELVAASKLRKSQERMKTSKPYAQKILQVIGHISQSNAEYQHPFLEDREEKKRAGYIMIGSDRGLCGSLNASLFRKVLVHIRELEKADMEMDVCPIGAKAVSMFTNLGMNVVADAERLGEKPQVSQLIGLVKVLLDAYEAGTIDVIYLCSNEFENTMSQKPKIQQLLPLAPVEDEESNLDYHWDYIYEPDAKEILDTLLRRYIESQVYQAVIENIACEQAARMVAMKSATDNAGKVINDLRLAYNKARQAAITQELSEIVSGADAIE